MPILSVPGMRAALEARRVPLVAVSPIVGGRALKGPAADILRSFDYPVSPVGVAAVYGELLDGLVIDSIDADMVATIEDMGPKVHVTDTVMTNVGDSVRLAQATISFARSIGAHVSSRGV